MGYAHEGENSQAQSLSFDRIIKKKLFLLKLKLYELNTQRHVEVVVEVELVVEVQGRPSRTSML
jgi:hypothetical protein